MAYISFPLLLLLCNKWLLRMCVGIDAFPSTCIGQNNGSQSFVEGGRSGKIQTVWHDVPWQAVLYPSERLRERYSAHGKSKLFQVLLCISPHWFTWRLKIMKLEVCNILYCQKILHIFIIFVC